MVQFGPEYSKGKSIHQVAKETGHDRKTIKKYLNQEDFNLPNPVRRTRTSKTDPYRDQIRLWLLSDQKAPRKQKHTAKRVYDRLVAQEDAAGRIFDVSERSIRSIVSELKKELGQQKIASLPYMTDS